MGQDAEGTLLGHVRDEGVTRTDPSVRLYRTRARQDFHTDGADLVGLLCLQRAASGGESRIASSATVYNELLRRRPDLVEVLYAPFYWDRNDEQSEGEDPFFALPVYSDVNGAPRMFYIGWYIRDAQRHPQVPRLTPAQIEAMELIETIANDPAFHIEMDFQPGDVQLLNNAKILHAREAYEDADDPREQTTPAAPLADRAPLHERRRHAPVRDPAARSVARRRCRRVDLEHGTLRVDHGAVEEHHQIRSHRHREHEPPRLAHARCVCSVDALRALGAADDGV